MISNKTIILEQINARLLNTSVESSEVIFSEDRINTAITRSLSTLRQFGILDLSNVFDLIISGAVVELLSSQSLLEVGREVTFRDHGIEYYPPAISSVLMKQWEVEYTMYMKKIELYLSLK